jgi:single-strand selective monofunctional uracil DNA glycosylase
LHRKLINAAARLRDEVDELSFDPPVTHVYNPLRYAWRAHQAYLRSVPSDGVRVLFLGMNPGPWGMAQTGVPFGEVATVRDWLGIEQPIDRPVDEHPRRPIEGFQCRRSEVSGRRLWGLFRDRFVTADQFFAEHFVANYCPLVFMESSARNRTPDKLPGPLRVALDERCDRHLNAVVELLRPKFAVGVGAYAEQALRRVTATTRAKPQVFRILHPSPASPAANRGWAATASQQLHLAGVW